DNDEDNDSFDGPILSDGIDDLTNYYDDIATNSDQPTTKISSESDLIHCATIRLNDISKKLENITINLTTYHQFQEISKEYDDIIEIFEPVIESDKLLTSLSTRIKQN